MLHRHDKIGGTGMIAVSDDWKGEARIRSVTRQVKEVAATVISETPDRKERDAITADAIRALAAKGLSTSKIAAELKVSVPRISKVAHRAGIHVPDGRVLRCGKWK